MSDTRLDALLQRVQLLEDKEAIRQCLSRYCFSADLRRMDDFVQLWTEDCTFEGGGKEWKGRDGVLALMNAPTSPSKNLQNALQHVFANIHIDVDGDTAVAEAYSLMVAQQDGRRDIISAAYNHFELVRHGGAWRIKLRRRQAMGQGDAREVISGYLKAGPEVAA